MRSKYARACMSVACAIGLSSSMFVSKALAASIAEIEGNNTRLTAQPVGLFTPNADPNVFGIGAPTASVTGAVGALNDADFYSFQGVAGATFYADLDDTPLLFDTYLGLFDSAGTVIAISDDTAGPSDPGSPARSDTDPSSRASFIGSFTLPSTGTYYVSVTDYGNRPVGRSGAGVTQVPLTRPDGVGLTGTSTAALFNNDAVVGAPVGNDSLMTSTGTSLTARTGTYTLNLTMIPQVPEPTTLSVLAAAAGVLIHRRRK